MNKEEIFNEIKQAALEEHIPIIMDDTLEVMSNYLEVNKPTKILEIGTAVRIFCYMFFKIFNRKWKNRYNWNGRAKSYKGKRKYRKNGVTKQN